jgi:hypothetical protein
LLGRSCNIALFIHAHPDSRAEATIRACKSRTTVFVRCDCTF